MLTKQLESYFNDSLEGKKLLLALKKQLVNMHFSLLISLLKKSHVSKLKALTSIMHI